MNSPLKTWLAWIVYANFSVALFCWLNTAKYGTLETRITPIGANVALVALSSASDPHHVFGPRVQWAATRRLCLAPGLYQCTAARDGFDPLETRIEVAAGRLAVVEMLLKRRADDATLVIDAAQPPVRLALRDVEGNVVERSIDREPANIALRPGPWELTAERSGCRPFIKRFDLRPRSRKEVRIPALVAAAGNIVFYVAPASAKLTLLAENGREVREDALGRPLQPTPGAAVDLPPGRYFATAESPKYAAYSGERELRDGESLAWDIRLVPADTSLVLKPATPGVRVRVMNDGGTLLLDQSLDEPRVLDGLCEGIYTIAATSAGYRPAEFAKRLEAGTSVAIDIRLERITWPLTIATNERPDALVVCDDRGRETARITAPSTEATVRLPDGRYRVAATKADFYSSETEVSIGGRDERLVLQLLSRKARATVVLMGTAYLREIAETIQQALTHLPEDSRPLIAHGRVYVMYRSNESEPWDIKSPLVVRENRLMPVDAPLDDAVESAVAWARRRVSATLPVIVLYPSLHQPSNSRKLAQKPAKIYWLGTRIEHESIDALKAVATDWNDFPAHDALRLDLADALARDLKRQP